MATNDSTACHNTLNDDLLITIEPRGYIHYYGSFAQLKAEGLIPDDFEFPNWDCSVSWNINGLGYYMRRCRPEGFKGKKELWANGDYWRLAVTQENKSFLDAVIYRKTQELNDIKFMYSRAGIAQGEKYWAAQKDKKFQAFKELIPGFIKPERGRRASLKQSANQEGGAA